MVSAQEASDSLRAETAETEILETVTEAVRGDSVSLRVATADLMKLPEGASWTKSLGRTHVRVSLRGDSVDVEARTDSLERTVRRYELSRTEKQTEAVNRNAELTVECSKREGRIRCMPLVACVLTVAVLMALEWHYFRRKK